MDIRSSILSFNTQVDTTAMTKSIISMKNQMENNVRDAFSTGMKHGLSLKHMDAVRKKMTMASQEIGQIQEKMHAEAAKMMDENASQAIKDAAKLKKQELANQLELQAQALHADQARIANLGQKLDQMRTDDEKSRLAMVGKSVETFGEGMHSIFSDITSKDVTSIFGVIQKGAAKLQQVQAKAVAAKEAGTGGGMAKIAGIMSKLGPALVAIGAIAAGFAAVVKIIIDADAQAKELHKALLDGGASVGDMTVGVGGLRDALSEVREMAVDVQNNWDWGTLAADQMKIVGAWNEAGYTLKEMSGDLKTAEDRMNAYQKATSAALTYSKLLGESADKVAQDMSGMMEQLGMSLGGVRENFAMIYDAAQTSGFGTKRFFGMVLQATTGMGMYNVRLEQTTAMLLNLNKILGTKFGADFFNKLTGQFSGDSAQEGMKKIMLRGGKQVSGTLQKQAEYTADGVMDIFKSSLGDDFATGLKDIFGAEGTELAAQLSNADTRGEGISNLVETLRKMNPKEQSAILVKTQKQIGSDASRQLQQLLIQANGINGSMGQQMTAMRALGPGGILVDSIERLKKAAGVSSMAELSGMSGLSQIIAENLDGIDSTMRDEIVRLTMTTSGQWEDMKKLQQDIKDGVYANDPEGLLKAQTEQIKAWGATATDANTIIAAKLDANGQVEEIGFKAMQSAEDLLMGMNKADGDVAKTMSEQEALAKQVASNTTDMATYLQMGVEWFLNGIYEVVESILSFLKGTSMNDTEKKNKEEALRRERNNGMVLQQQLRDQQKALIDAQTKMDSETDPGKRASLQVEIDDLISGISNTRLLVSNSQDALRQIRSTGGRFAGTKTTDEFQKEGREEALAKELGRIVQKGSVKPGRAQNLKYGGTLTDDDYEKTTTYDKDALTKAFQKYVPDAAKQIEAWKAAGGEEKVTEELEKWGEEQWAASQQMAATITDGQKAISQQEDVDADKRQTAKITADQGKTARIQARENAIANRDEALRALIENALQTSVSDQMVQAIKKGNVPGISGTARKDILKQWRTNQPVENVEDFILTSSGRIIKPSSEDTITGSKPGGPLDKKRGGSTSIINNYYLPNDANQNLMAITKAQKAGVI